MITYMVYLSVGRIFYLREVSSVLVSICRLSTYWGMRFYHPQASSSDKQWAVGWIQPDLLPFEVVSLVIGISQGVLARWRESTFIFIGNGQGLLARWRKYTFILIGISQGVLIRWQRSDTSKPSVLAMVYWFDGKNLGGLLETTKPDVCTRLERFWNDKNSARLDYLETQIRFRDVWTALSPR